MRFKHYCKQVAIAHTFFFACTWHSLWISALAVGDISYQQGSRCEREHRRTKITEQKTWTVYGQIIVGREHEEMKMIEIKLAPEGQTNTPYTSKDRGVSLYISVSFILSLFLNLSISVTICLPLISSLTICLPFADSLSLSFFPQQWDNKWPAL